MRIKLKDIMAIAGHPGLFKYIKQGRNGIIVEALDTQKRMNAHASMKVSSLEDITIFTEGEDDKPLPELMKAIFDKQNGKQSIDAKKSSNEELKKYFSEVLPEFDKERVYVSDIKKIITWYNVLQKLNMLEVEEVKEEKAEETKETNNKEAEETKKPAAKKKAAATKKDSKQSSVKAKVQPKTQPKTKAVPLQKKQTQTQKKAG